jgi:hypothetical protein
MDVRCKGRQGLYTGGRPPISARAFGSDVNAAGGYGGRTALLAASEGGHLLVVERLLGEGAKKVRNLLQFDLST